ncbi:MAG: biopolymer transporter ExbD [Kofleriaceae bacterium]|nr:biopolymer transporter ExbD [Kofleriaceae bacterium]
MASNVFEEDEEVIASINIVPFVDIVLVLLIIFMITSSAISRASIRVDLPTAASAGSAVASTLNIVLTAEGDIFLNGKPTTHQALGTYVARASWKDKDLQAVISADTSINYGRVIKIIDVVKSNGVKSFALNIEREI